MTITRETIYKRTSSGKVQIWYGELDEQGSYRTTSGQQDGKKNTSAWTLCKAKNEGKINGTTTVEQAAQELAATYEKKLAREYRRSLDDIDTKYYVKPMLADKWKDRKDKVPANSLIFFQPKLDGMRAIAQPSGVTASGVALTSRDGKVIPGAKHIEEALAPLFKRMPDLLLDGELYNHEFKDKFESLMSALKREPKDQADRDRAAAVVQYHVYDIPSEADKNFAVRNAALQELFANEPELVEPFIHSVQTDSLIYNDPGKEQLDELLGDALQGGYEGGMVRFNTPYEFKRSKGLLKMKDFMDAEFEIAGIEEGKGNWAGIAKRIWIVVLTAPVSHGDYIINRDTGAIEKFDGSQRNYARVSKATPKGSQDINRELLKNKADAIGKPGTVQYFRITNDGVPYLPIFKGVRWDI